MAKRTTMSDVNLAPDRTGLRGAHSAAWHVKSELMLQAMRLMLISNAMPKLALDDILERDRDIDQMYNALFREFLTFMMEDPRYITPCMHLHFIAKNTERMGDHVTSISPNR